VPKTRCECEFTILFPFYLKPLKPSPNPSHSSPLHFPALVDENGERIKTQVEETKSPASQKVIGKALDRPRTAQ